ncbi:MAG: sulfotransferase domain-containing protein [Actinomycetota bacterium]
MRDIVKRTTEGYLAATSGLRMLPDFAVIGTQRGGTTSLYRYLAAHPGVAPTLVSKGVHYFDVGFDRSPAWYRGHFPPRAYRAWRRGVARQPLITGEASPYYLFHPAVPARVAALLPDVKLIAMLRDPVKRAFSHYHHEFEGGFETFPTFEAAIDAEPGRLEGEAQRLIEDPAYVSFSHQHHSYLARGRYAEQLESWFAQVPRERFLIFTSEEFYRDTAAVYGAVQDFLGLPRHPLAEFKTYNAHAYAPMSPATNERLRGYFREPDGRLSELLGRDLGWDRSR